MEIVLKNSREDTIDVIDKATCRTEQVCLDAEIGRERDEEILEWIE